MNLTITKLNSKPFDGQYGKTNKVGILTKEYGDKWLNGFVDKVNFQVGDIIIAEIATKGDFTNFKFQGIKQGNTVVSPQMSQSTINTPNTPPQPVYQEKTDDEKWERINFGKCKHQFLLEAFKHKINDRGAILELTEEQEKQIEEWAKMSMRILEKTPPMGNNTQEIIPEETADDINIENIPF